MFLLAQNGPKPCLSVCYRSCAHRLGLCPASACSGPTALQPILAVCSDPAARCKHRWVKNHCRPPSPTLTMTSPGRPVLAPPAAGAPFRFAPMTSGERVAPPVLDHGCRPSSSFLSHPVLHLRFLCFLSLFHLLPHCFLHGFQHKHLLY